MPRSSHPAHAIRIVLLIALATLLPVALQAQSNPETETVEIDTGARTHPFPHFWEKMFGSGRAILSLRDGYRNDLRETKRITGFEYVRFHAIFHDEAGFYDEDKDGHAIYNYSYVDQIYDGLLQNHVRPFIELSFMPKKLTSDPNALHAFWYKQNVAPPKDWSKWEQMIESFTRQLVDRYGIEEVAQWYFEVWNEPNIQLFLTPQFSGKKIVGPAYVDVAAAYKEIPGRLVLGMTASPGSSAEKILEVCGNLGITAVEIRTEYDADVVPYLHELAIQPIRVEAPDVSKEIRGLLQTVYEEQVERLKKAGFLAGKPKVSLKDLLAAGNEARKRLDSGVRDGRLYGALTAQAIAMKANHAIELAETQGIGSLRSYFEKMQADVHSKADTQFLKHAKVREAIRLANESEVEHPKLAKTGWVVREQFMQKPDSKVIVFAHYRETADRLTQDLGRIPGIKAVRFVGQASRGEDIGLSQKEQVEILEKFRAGEVNVLVATSIGEEGLDIPQVDLVVFYEPVPSEIRTIQRRGRTGRSAAGRVVMLVTKDTRDEAYFYSARRKERKMHEELDRLRKELRQRIFVGDPDGETLVSAAPDRRIEALREASHESPARLPARRSDAKKGQTTVEDF